MTDHVLRLSRISLRTRFTLLAVALVFGITLLLSWVAARHSADQLEANIGASTAESAYQMVDKLDRSMDARIKEVKLLLGIEALTTGIDNNQLRTQLETLQDNYNVVSWIGFTDPNGVVQAASGGILEGASIAERPVFQNGREGMWIGDVHDAVLLSQRLPNPYGEALQFVDIATPVYTQDDTFLGVLAVHLSWEWAAYIQRAMFSPAQRRQGTELFLLSADGTVLLGPDDMLGQPINALTPLVTSATASPTWTIERWPDGQRYVTGVARSQGYEDFPGLGWVAVSRQPIEQAFAPVERLQYVIIGVGVLLALIFAVIGWVMASRLTAPLTRLSHAADNIHDTTQTPSDIPLETGSPELKRLSTSMRNMVGRLLDQNRTIRHLEDLANSDPLTGLPNRTFLNHYLLNALPEAQRQQQSIALVYIDLDGFKQVNDELGHHAGDLLLIDITQRLQDVLRVDDLVVRWGGDEFAMVLQAPTHLLEALTHDVSQRVITAITQPVALPEHPAVTVSCSLGAAWWPEHSQDIEEVMRLADAALYTAKEKGKHRLVIHQP
ncbi:sensor domain-containing diguanylate cyclase [Vreelandella arcis]|uniref:Diguanylate cyclase (GGDEF) domain-containing protein n=1 Tax=Vreelandella arcis TaxID=416873 RepID=A0A1H0GXM6_9GAMM|nr:sensor domain-containing diguanylate cyclase [Halomonas arcis]SDO11637.1 diguanylate cyclase (GGDEF) domain-containing protein [Halomonas arcis]